MNEIGPVKPIRIIPAFLLFLIPGLVFYLILHCLVPFLAGLLHANSYVVWMFAGSFLLFGPLIAMTLILLKRDGYALNLKTIGERLRLKKINGGVM